MAGVWPDACGADHPRLARCRRLKWCHGHFGQHPGSPLAPRQSRLGLDKTILTYLLDGLENDGLVKRTPDPQDRRIRHIKITAKGQKTLAKFTRAVEQVEKQVLSRLNPEEAAWFQRSLSRAAGLDADNAQSPDEAESVEICQAALGTSQAC